MSLGSAQGVNRLWLAAEYTNGAVSPGCPDAGSRWCRQFGYDAYGNRSVANSSVAFANQPVLFDPATNRIADAGWSYDTVNQRGTVTGDPGGDLYTYELQFGTG